MPAAGLYSRPDPMSVGPVRSRADAIKAFLREIVVVTVGILIALSLDGVVDWRREAKLVRETRASIQSEIADNRKVLASIVAALPNTRAQLELTLKTVGVVLEHRETGQGPAPDSSVLSRAFGVFTVDLSSTARATAETTGALVHMNYAEVQRYATVYGLQQEFMRLHARMYDAFIQMDSIRQISIDRLSKNELENWRQNVVTTLGYLRALESMGKTLLPVYRGILSAP